MNTPVSFPIAKLLKEKRYDKPCLKCYLEDGSVQISSGDEGDLEEYNHNQWDNYSAPTIAEVVMWLYEKHGIWIYIKPGVRQKTWDYIVQKEDCDFAIPFFEIKQHKPFFNFPTEAYEAAIEYTSTKLI